MVRQSDCREFVANRSRAPSDRSPSLGWNHAGVAGGAVPTLACARSRRAIGAEFPCLDAPALCVQLLRCQWFSRLCVLMNPILPGSRSIRTWPAKCLKLELSRAGQFRGTQEVNLSNAVWAKGHPSDENLSLGPRFAPRPSVYEAAHADIHRHAQRQERKQHRRSAVTH